MASSEGHKPLVAGDGRKKEVRCMPRPKAKPPEGFGGEIYQIRQEKGLTFDAIEKATGIPSRTLQDWEKGRRTPPEWNRNLILCALKKIEKT
jgi:DNA-binding transcriptional regulator YiaG